jgi:hypothetical protein
MRRLALILALALVAPLHAEESDALVTPDHSLAPDDPAWAELAAGLRDKPGVTADFTEQRRFAFKKTPTVLKGEARVSTEHGLSLHYLEPETQTVIIDAQGLLVRSAAGDTIPPADPAALAANAALLHVLRLELRPLAEIFELYGVHTGTAWTIALVPRAADLRRTLGRISVEGEGAAVRRIEFRRSATQRVEILVEPPRAIAAFTAEELRRFFR